MALPYLYGKLTSLMKFRMVSTGFAMMFSCSLPGGPKAVSWLHIPTGRVPLFRLPAHTTYRFDSLCILQFCVGFVGDECPVNIPTILLTSVLFRERSFCVSSLDGLMDNLLRLQVFGIKVEYRRNR